jgi:hypothetical protein
MIPNRPLKPEEKIWLSYWKTVCRECFGWSESQTEAWVDSDVPDFDYDNSIWQYHDHPMEEVRRLFIPEKLRERFRQGNLNGLLEFYDGLGEILFVGWEQIHEGFPTDFDWDSARVRIRRLTSEFTAKNTPHGG